MAIVQDYLALTKKYRIDYGEKTVLLYQVGSFFELYGLLNTDGTYIGSDIEYIAKINDMTIAHKNSTVDGKQVVMAGVGVAYVDKYIQKIQEHGYTIVIYKQDIDKKNTTRSLSEIISPGTFFPVELEQEVLSNNIMCVWLHKTSFTKRNSTSELIFGIATIDIYTGKTSLYQFSTDCLNSPTSYDELERYISAYRPSECLLIANVPDKMVNDIIGFVGLENAKINKIVMGSVAQVNAEKQIYQQETLHRFFSSIKFDTTYYIAIQSFCYLLDFVYQHNPNLISRLTEPVLENNSERLVLANHSLKQLNIIDDARHTGKLRSVSNFLNNCMTTMGKRQFLYTLHYPITNEIALQSFYDITEHLLTDGENRWQTIRTSLSSIGDLEKFTRKVVNKKVVPKNLSSLVEDLKIIMQLYEQTKEDKVLANYLVNSMPDEKQACVSQACVSQACVSQACVSQACVSIINDITTFFNLDHCSTCVTINDAAIIINREISATLDALLRDSLDGRDKLETIRAFLSDLIKSSLEKDAIYVRLHETARSDAQLIATSRRALLLKEAIKKCKQSSVTLSYQSKYSLQQDTFIFDLSTIDYDTSGGGKNDVVITSREIKAITSSNEEAKTKLVKEMELIFQKYIQDFVKFEEQLKAIVNYTSEMDLLQNKCYIANKYNYCKPTIASSNDSSNSFFSFTGIRHPLIEHLQTEELYVTNDLTLGNNNSSDTNSDSITSPYFEKKSSDDIGSEGESTDRATMGGSRALGGLAHRGVLLYGTNAVGKTSFIKSVGIAMIMAQAGLYVPCTTFTYKPYKTIFTRILGNDNLFKGLSTFAVEMTELRTILTMADKNSLVLGDELCSGTESDSALSIFTAGLEILHEKDSTFLFATHFHEINKYDEIKSLDKLTMMHMAVHYNKATNALVYDRKLREGPGESMYGLEVCKSLHLPEAFLKRAHDIRMKYKEDKQSILSLSPTHFNARKLMGICELCRDKKASEVHHLQHQKYANSKNNYIDTFHKNHLANLLNICDMCHKKIHQTGQQHKVVKTTDGNYILEGL